MNGPGGVRISLILTLVTVIVLSSISYAESPSDRCILIKVKVADRDDINTLANEGLDIWEYREGGLIVRVTDDERKQIQQKGFAIETITEDVYEYQEIKRQEQLSQFRITTARYHTYSEVIAKLSALEESGIAKTYIIGNTHEGRDIRAVRISDNPAEDEDEPGAIFLGCHHAREWISIEVPLYIAQYLVDNYDSDVQIKHLVDNSQIWIVPVVNPDGYEYSRTTDSMWRKNRRDNGDRTFGVDLNRNYSYMWGGNGSSSNTSSETYRGPDAFSEPESRAVRDLVLSYDFRVLMSYHNFGQKTVNPWMHTKDPSPDDFPMGSIAFRTREIIKETSGSVYTDWWDNPGAYIVSGDTGDWSYGEHGIYSFTIELPPKEGGFYLAENKIIPTCQENLPAALYLISLAADNGGIENLRSGRTYGSIQFAINDALDGDTIVISEGTYRENILFRGKNITLRSTEPGDPAAVAATVIDGDFDRAIIMPEGRNTGCELNGLKITSDKTVISCYETSPTIRNCVIESTAPVAIEFGEGHEPTIIDSDILGAVTEVVDSRIMNYRSPDEKQGDIACDNIGGPDGILSGGWTWRPDGGRFQLIE